MTEEKEWTVVVTVLLALLMLLAALRALLLLLLVVGEEVEVEELEVSGFDTLDEKDMAGIGTSAVAARG